MRENSIASTAGQLSDICKHQSGSSFSFVPQVWFPFYQQTCLHVAAGKQYSGLFLLGSRYSGGAQAVVTPGGSRAGGDWLTPNSESPELPLLIQTTQTFGWLDNMKLHSQWEVFSSQPSGNLDKGLMFPHGTPGWGRLKSETILDAGECVPSLMLQIVLGDSKAFRELQSPIFFLRDFVLWIWLEKKDRNSGQGWTSLGPSWLWVEFQTPGFTVRCWCNSQATFEEAKEERVFRQRVMW